MNNNTKILLICDNNADIQNIKLRLEESVKIPCFIWHYKTLAEAIEILENNKLRADIIILDLELISTTNPRDIYQKMGDAASNIPIIVLTGTNEADKNLATFVMEAGAADHIVKGQFSRIADAIQFSLIRHKLSDEANECIKNKNDEDIIKKNQFISWVTGGYSV